YGQQIEIQVHDDCGTPLTNATVIASFNNGDPPLSVDSLQNGIYSRTWNPSHPGSQVTVTINATSPPLTPASIQAFGNSAANPSAPAIGQGGVVNGASFAPSAPLAPGAIISVFGANLASGSGGAS